MDVRRLDQQEVILAETEVRIKSLLGLGARERMKTPLAMILGKFDTWLPLLGGEPLAPAVRDGRVDPIAIRQNSDRLRQLMLTIAPNAEAISSDVRYFANGPLGASPVQFTDSRGVKMIGPDPAKLAPMFVGMPDALGVLACRAGAYPVAPGSLIAWLGNSSTPAHHVCSKPGAAASEQLLGIETSRRWSWPPSNGSANSRGSRVSIPRE